MPRPGHGARAAAAILLVVTAGTVGMLAADARRGTAAKAAPGLRANLLPQGVDGAPAPRIRLADQRGRAVDSARLRGRPYLVTFLYTRCPDVCPLIGDEIADALGGLGPRAERVAVLAVSVDPRGDTPGAARAWTAGHRLPPQFHYLLGTAAQLTAVWRAWYVVPPDGRLTDPREHDASVWLVDGRGRLRGRWDGGDGIRPGDVAHDLSELIEAPSSAA